MRTNQLVALNRLQQSEFNDTQEIVEGVLEFVEAGFETLEDGKVNFGDAGAWIMIFGPVQRAIDEGKDSIRELATMSDEQFDETFEKGAAGFDLRDNSLEHDIKGVAKGLLHGVRIMARSRYQKAA